MADGSRSFDNVVAFARWSRTNFLSDFRIVASATISIFYCRFTGKPLGSDANRWRPD